MSLRIAIDTGGAFTDVVAIDASDGQQFVIKTPSTPHDPSEGLLNGIEKVLEVAERPANDVSLLLHGSTTATNAVLEHKFAGLGLIVTKGFRHLIEIARQSVPDGYGNSLFWVKPPRLVPLHLVREAPGRMDHYGNVLEELDEEAVLHGVEELVEQGVQCVAVCPLHSYANDAHEKRIGELIAERFPDIFVSLSSVVLPEYREYERAMTTLIDVLVKPYCQTYLKRAADKVREQAEQIPFLIMQSNGGVVTHEFAGNKPVTMLLSGPAGGVLGSVHLSRLAGFNNILMIDVGGTSTDVSLVTDLKPQMISYSQMESYPVKTPMLDIVTVGTGGGSLAWVDDYGGLKVEPQSSGAVPRPICYRRGVTKPTITDAAVVMGRLPDALVGGDRIVTTGGWGDALEREPEMVCYDVLCGLVSEEAARTSYGVVLKANGKAYDVDEAATRKLREEMRSKRGSLPMFDRGPYFDEKLEAGEINWPEGWEDPDANCYAVEPSLVWKPHNAA